MVYEYGIHYNKRVFYRYCFIFFRLLVYGNTSYFSIIELLKSIPFPLLYKALLQYFTKNTLLVLYIKIYTNLVHIQLRKSKLKGSFKVFQSLNVVVFVFLYLKYYEKKISWWFLKVSKVRECTMAK